MPNFKLNYRLKCTPIWYFQRESINLGRLFVSPCMSINHIQLQWVCGITVWEDNMNYLKHLFKTLTWGIFHRCELRPAWEPCIIASSAWETWTPKNPGCTETDTLHTSRRDLLHYQKALRSVPVVVVKEIILMWSVFLHSKEWTYQYL